MIPARFLSVRVAMSKPHDLKTIGLKATLPRLKILNLFETSDIRHLTAEDIYKVLLKEGMDIGLATIYRVLTQFEQAGILIRHHFEAGKAVFELNEGGHHDHLVCIQCGHVEEFFDSEIEKRQLKVAKDTSIHCRSTRTASKSTVPTARSLRERLIQSCDATSRLPRLKPFSPTEAACET
jgi:Fur family ferric uptake transcriptional regulator